MSETREQEISIKRHAAWANDIGDPEAEAEKKKVLGERVQWTTADGIRYLPAGTTIKSIDPGYYDICVSGQVGIYFEKLKLKEETILQMPGTPLEEVLKEVKKFLAAEALYRKFGVPFKRGFLMYGPQGGGKTTLITELLKLFIEAGGVGLKFSDPKLFTAGLKDFRKIQPDTPVLVVMEDLDTITKVVGESELLNVLDGAEDIHRVLFIATTNYPEMLSPRLINRPSRFDKRILIPHPDDAGRKLYVQNLMERSESELPIDLDVWVAKTKGFSMAHMKELFIATQILGDDLDKSIETLKLMGLKLTSDGDGSTAQRAIGAGFSTGE